MPPTPPPPPPPPPRFRRRCSSISHQAPSTTSHQAPSSTSHQAPSTTSHQAPSSTSHQAPSSTSHQAPSSTSHQAPSSTSHQAPSSTSHQASSSGLSTFRKQCIVEGCPVCIAPSMWHNHMTLHANGALPGNVLSECRLRDQYMFVCPSCSQLVANSRHASYLRQCSHRCMAPVSLQLPVFIPFSEASHGLLSFDQVCQRNHPTLQYIPAKARPAFARALSSSLRDVLQRNTEDAWLKHFMLSKCVPPLLEAQRESQATHTNRVSLQHVAQCSGDGTATATAAMAAPLFTAEINNSLLIN